MSPQQPRYSAEETSWHGDEIYEREMRARVEAGNPGNDFAVDIETGACALDENALAAAKRLRAQRPMPRSGSCGLVTARCTDWKKP